MTDTQRAPGGSLRPAELQGLLIERFVLRVEHELEGRFMRDGRIGGVIVPGNNLSTGMQGPSKEEDGEGELHVRDRWGLVRC